jgi:hypothetical protein
MKKRKDDDDDDEAIAFLLCHRKPFSNDPLEFVVFVYLSTMLITIPIWRRNHRYKAEHLIGE